MAAIEKERVTATLIVPTMIQMLTDHPHFHTADLSSLKRIMYGASPMSEALLNRAMAGLPGRNSLSSYGMTELAPLATLLGGMSISSRGRDEKTGKRLGRPPRLRASDRRCRSQPVLAAVGEVTVRGQNVMRGYWKRLKKRPQPLSTAG